MSFNAGKSYATCCCLEMIKAIFLWLSHFSGNCLLISETSHVTCGCLEMINAFLGGFPILVEFAF